LFATEFDVAVVILQELSTVAAKAPAPHKATQAAAIIFMFIFTSKKKVENFSGPLSTSLAVHMTPITEMVNLHFCFDVMA
jgi:hypothetical protein